MAAVRSGNPEAMAAGYAADAVLVRPDDVHRGREEILAYFRTVPERLGSARVEFDDLVISQDTAVFRWHLEGAESAVSGTDTCTVVAGAIVRQVVTLDVEDF